MPLADIMSQGQRVAAHRPWPRVIVTAQVWRDVTRTGIVTNEHRTAMRLAATWPIHQATSVVDPAYHMAGATAVFRANPFERRFRDMHAIAQQIQARDTHYEDVGKAILGNSSERPAITKMKPSG